MVTFGGEFNQRVVVVEGSDKIVEFRNRMWPEDENVIDVTFIIRLA